MADAKELFDLACDRVLEIFKLVSLKDLQRKALEKLVDDEDALGVRESPVFSNPHRLSSKL